MQQLEKTLAEQLKITPQEIARRKEMLEFTPADEEVLRNNKSLFQKYIDGMVKNFYDKQISVPEIARLIGDADSIRHLYVAMHRYILELFDGNYDDIYANRRLRIGKVHHRMGVSSTQYISAMQMLRTALNQTVDMTFFKPEDLMNANILKAAISKILMFDMQLVFDTFIASMANEVNAAKDEVSRYAANLESEVAKRTRQLEVLSLKDSLTGLSNQRAFYDHLRRELSSAERYKEVLSLCYLDLNGFKQINDSLGHQTGDDLLALVGKAMLDVTRESDIACRYGGDEFCMILPKTSLKEATIVVNRLIKLFNKVDNQDVTFSVGISCTNADSADSADSRDRYIDSDDLVKKADTLMYKSKAASKKKQGHYITTDIEKTKPA
ncbi:MAG: GGDEF domain-containing protein [Sulfuriflexus sp.]|nr:GGDEF domain-containing protein [Sulfuriflexus sp.]